MFGDRRFFPSGYLLPSGDQGKEINGNGVPKDPSFFNVMVFDVFVERCFGSGNEVLGNAIFISSVLQLDVCYVVIRL